MTTTTTAEAPAPRPRRRRKADYEVAWYWADQRPETAPFLGAAIDHVKAFDAEDAVLALRRKLRQEYTFARKAIVIVEVAPV
ncbi:hypothetical protein [Rhodococcus sp. 11-3]|uniref:hypothetical protein n=1 Tax=Rhodococcus sp. 11-3 TaxID=2854796 RepID=UPI00203E28D4|nr:hypothetical protein [Rhodococcus sp. 11-3]USC17067.1 hypothetical protein KZJ41_09445 [Rhodococcus sp. 11-3]